MPELGEGVIGVVEPRQEIPGLGRTIVEHPGITPSKGYLDSACARLERKVNVDKAAQGRKGRWDADRTVLLVDLSTARLAQLLGQDGLAEWLDNVPVEWGDLPFAAMAVCFSHPQGLLLRGCCRYRPDLETIERAHLDLCFRHSACPPQTDPRSPPARQEARRCQRSQRLRGVGAEGSASAQSR